MNFGRARSFNLVLPSTLIAVHPLRDTNSILYAAVTQAITYRGLNFMRKKNLSV